MAIATVLIAATVAAQDKPDFSGTWILETSVGADPDVARSLTVRQPVVRTKVSGAPMAPFFKELSVERRFVTDVRTETYQIGVEGGVVGGVHPANDGTTTEVNITQTRYSVRWEDSRLVMNTGSYSGPNREAGSYTEHTEVWTLDAAGMLIVSIADRGSGIASRTKILTYRRN